MVYLHELARKPQLANKSYNKNQNGKHDRVRVAKCRGFARKNKITDLNNKHKHLCNENNLLVYGEQALNSTLKIRNAMTKIRLR